MAIPGLSTLGIEVGYAIVTTTASLPASVTVLPRCNSADGIEITQNSIDASALEDYVTQHVAGRADTPETWGMTFNNTPDARTAVAGMISAYATSKASDSDTVVCIEIYDPKDTGGAYWLFIEPPSILGMSELSQNTLKTFPLTSALVTVYGYSTGVAPDDGGSN